MYLANWYEGLSLVYQMKIFISLVVFKDVFTTVAIAYTCYKLGQYSTSNQTKTKEVKNV